MSNSLHYSRAAHGKYALWAALTTLVFCLGCKDPNDPFAYVKVSGKVAYEDGSLIPSQDIVLSFIPESEGVGPKIRPKTAEAVVDAANGTFTRATSHKFGDGVVRGKLKVTVTGSNHTQLPTDVVAEEFGDPTRTTLEVDTDKLPFDIKVPKPH